MSTAFVFPGQGSQYVGMGTKWYRASLEARVFCDKANAQLDFALTELCFHGPESKLNQTRYTQPAIFVISLAMWHAAQAHLPTPTFVAGHSLGEFAALTVAGALEFPAALKLVTARGRLMETASAASPGGMLVMLGVSVETVQSLCDAVMQQTGEVIVIANDNCPGQVVVSGSLKALGSADALARDYRIRRTQRLTISVAPHSPLMAQIQAEFTDLILSTPISTPQVPVVLNATATTLSEPEAIRQALVQQLTSPVRWRESVLWMANHGADHFIEIGPKKTLTGLVKRTLREVALENLDTDVIEDWLTPVRKGEI